MASVGDSRSVGSPALETGRYLHAACTNSENFIKGSLLPLCANPRCPNKGANWVLQEKSLSEVPTVP
jgi:hypothetical protein